MTTFPLRIPFQSIALGLALSAFVGTAWADVTIGGALDDMRVEADRAPVVEVLEALQQRFGVIYESRADLDWTVEGIFSGPLPSVLTRIFRDKDYAFRINADNSVVIFIVSPPGLAAEATTPPPVNAVMVRPPGEPVSLAVQKPPPPVCLEVRPALPQGARAEAWLGALARATR